MVFSGVVPMFEFEFSNETENGSNEERNIIIVCLKSRVAQEQTVYYNGDSEIGVTIQIHAIGTVENVTIYNTGTREFIKIDTEKLKSITGSTIVAGDDIYICTVKGKKSVTLLRNGVRTNILNCLYKAILHGFSW